MLIKTLEAMVAPIVAAVAFVAGRRKASAEADKTVTESESVTVSTALSLLGPMRDHIAELRKEMGELRARMVVVEMHNDELARAVEILSAQIVDLGHVPGWPPSFTD